MRRFLIMTGFGVWLFCFPIFAQISSYTMQAKYPASNDNYGRVLAFDGERAIVARDNPPGVHFYLKTGLSLPLEKYIFQAFDDQDMIYGVDISGDNAVVVGSDDLFRKPVVFFYSRESGDWALIQTYEIPDGENWAVYSDSYSNRACLSLSGPWLALAIEQGGIGGQQKVMIFRRSMINGTWGIDQEIINNCTVSRFGASVDWSLPWLLISSPNNEFPGCTYPDNTTFLFRFNHGSLSFELEDQVASPIPAGNGLFGYEAKLAPISADYAVISQPVPDGPEEPALTASYIQNGGNWQYADHLDFGNTNQDRNGTALTTADNIVILGAYEYDVGGAANAGRLRYYRVESSGDLTELGALESLLPAEHEGFGRIVDAGGGCYLVGSRAAFDEGRAFFICGYPFEGISAIDFSLVEGGNPLPVEGGEVGYELELIWGPEGETPPEFLRSVYLKYLENDREMLLVGEPQEVVFEDDLHQESGSIEISGKYPPGYYQLIIELVSQNPEQPVVYREARQFRKAGEQWEKSGSIAGNSVPAKTVLKQNYPNPFNPETVIRYTLSVDRPVTLKIYDILGREIRTLVNGQQTAGEYTVSWDGRDASGARVVSGIYYYQLKAGEFNEVRKLLLNR